jgi:phage terminase Nu1 subunit (DNA packaging protein)
MDKLVTREQLAAMWSVHVVTIDRWIAQGMPTVTPGTGSGRAGGPLKLLVTRRALARHFGVNADTVTKWLPLGLGAAVVERGGRGKESTFWLPEAITWHLAWTDELSQHVLEDFEARALAGVRLAFQLSDTTDRPEEER